MVVSTLTRIWRLMGEHLEATWWAAWLLAALGWALWSVIR